MSSGSLSAHQARAALGASAIGGLALWFNHGALDVAGTAGATYRVAMLPSWPELVGFVVLMLIAAAAAALMLQRTQRMRSGEKALAWDPALNEALRPLFALAILALPYVPWIPDWIPALRLLAGPVRWLIWAIVLGEIGWILLGTPARLPRWGPRRTPVAASVLRAPRSVSPGVASLAVFAVSFAVYAGVSDREWRFDPEARALFPMLETFDAAVRPLAVRYDPFFVVSPSAIPRLFSLTAVPGQRLARQPLPVVLNARFRLPAGEYEVEFEGSDVTGKVPHGTMGLQIGREGSPLQTWPFTVSRASPWRRRFLIPLDAEFVGFRTSPEVARTISALRLQPVRILDAGRRLRTGTILSAASFGSTAIFFHDEAYAELDGFWVKGQTTVRTTIRKGAASTEAIGLNLHCGARPNVVTLATPHWSQRLELVPNVTRTVVVPSDRRASLVSLSITTSSGFVPAEVEPGSSDRRLLGCWIAFAQ